MIIADPRGMKGTCTPLSPISFIFMQFFGKNLVKQECIPVGCVPPARYCTGELSLTETPQAETPQTKTPLGRDPPDRDPPWQRPPRQRPPWVETPQTETPPGQRSPRQRPPWAETPQTETPLWTEWHTGVKTLSCHNFIAGGNNRFLAQTLGLAPLWEVWIRHWSG